MNISRKTAASRLKKLKDKELIERIEKRLWEDKYIVRKKIGVYYNEN